MLARAVALCLAISLASPPAHAERTIAVAPLSTLGTEDTSSGTRQITASIEVALRALAGTKVVTSAQVADAIKRAKKPQLRTCEGDPACLAEIGRLVNASIVISGEVGGLAESRVVYLGAIDVATRKELRSTTLAVGLKHDQAGGPSGAIVRLLDPDRYRGTLHFAIDVTRATVYINGTRVTLNAKAEVALPVGTHAVRVTHPAYRDFVRFVEVPYARTTDVAVGMQQFPILQRDVLGKPRNSDTIEYIEPPLWRRWYVAGPAAVGIAIVTGIVVGLLVHDLPSEPCRKVGGEPC